jgi:hypothetical protein
MKTTKARWRAEMERDAAKHALKEAVGYIKAHPGQTDIPISHIRNLQAIIMKPLPE